MPQEPRDHQLTIRIPQRIRDALAAQAEHEQRTVADVINNLLAARFPPPSKFEIAPAKKMVDLGNRDIVVKKVIK